MSGLGTNINSIEREREREKGGIFFVNILWHPEIFFSFWNNTLSLLCAILFCIIIRVACFISRATYSLALHNTPRKKDL